MRGLFSRNETTYKKTPLNSGSEQAPATTAVDGSPVLQMVVSLVSLMFLQQYLGLQADVAD